MSFPEGTQRFEHTLRGVIHGALLTRAEILGNVSDEELKKSAAALFINEQEQTPQLLGRVGEFEILFWSVDFTAVERGLRKPDPVGRANGKCHVQISGRSSARAMDSLARQLAPLAQSHFRSVKELVSDLSPENFKDFLPFAFSSLEMAVLDTSNKDTFQRRIANAVRLLAVADNQRSDPIGLSLSVTAIDALLGRKGQEMANKLADFVAGLLESEVGSRRQAADFVIDLYDKRSRVLHGDRLEGNARLRMEARKLAASVLWGVWSYQDFFERLYSDDPKPDDFFRELRQNFVKSGLPVGVLELPVRALWQKKSIDE